MSIQESKDKNKIRSTNKSVMVRLDLKRRLALRKLAGQADRTVSYIIRVAVDRLIAAAEEAQRQEQAKEKQEPG